VLVACFMNMRLCFKLALTPPEPTCKAKVDVGFILDSSGSLRADYGKEKDFLKALAASFGIGVNASRAGVVTFSYFTEHSIRMKDHDNLVSFNEAVDKIPLMGSTTRIDKALRLAQKELFSLVNGARPGVPKLLILLTDGSQTRDADAEEPGDIAEEIRKSGVKVVVVGIGSGVNKTELSHLSGGGANLYTAASFDELIGIPFVTEVTRSACSNGMYCIFML
jgi:Mg-chelatase subunit ChlD